MTRVYPPEFYHKQQEGSLRSARRVLPHVLELIQPKSIVDVGSGVGTWLAAARELGVSDVVGLDGDYVDRRMLRIPPELFRPTDLSRAFTLERTFDLALSLEVAEHLPEACADSFVDSITRLAPAILFSAAIPRQGGEDHRNEQWQSWWIDRFEHRGFVPVDCIRPRIWHDDEVEWWYAQNMLLMARKDWLRTALSLRQLIANDTAPRDVVHPRAFIARLTAAEQLRPRGVREWLAIGPSVIAATAKRLVSR